MITMLTLMAVQPALAQECDPTGVAVFFGKDTPSDTQITGPLDADQAIVTDQSDYAALPPIRVAIGSAPHFVALVADSDGDGDVPATDCDCIWDLDSADSDESDVTQSVVSTSDGDVDLARYFAPVDLVACESEERVLRLNCGNSESAWRQVKLEIAPSDINGQPLTDSSGNAVGWERCSVQGGGCLSPQGVGDPVESAVWLLFPLIGLGGLARRRD